MRTHDWTTEGHRERHHEQDHRHYRSIERIWGNDGPSACRRRPLERCAATISARPRQAMMLWNCSSSVPWLTIRKDATAVPLGVYPELRVLGQATNERDPVEGWSAAAG
jgi:hypothetical protein